MAVNKIFSGPFVILLALLLVIAFTQGTPFPANFSQLSIDKGSHDTVQIDNVEELTVADASDERDCRYFTDHCMSDEECCKPYKCVGSNPGHPGASPQYGICFASIKRG